MSVIEPEMGAVSAAGAGNPPGPSARAAIAEPAIRPCIGEYAPLSPWQHGIWLFDQLHRASATYNIPYRLQLDGDLDVAALQRAIREIFRRHTILRSRVVEEHGEVQRGEPAQRVLPLEQVDLQWFDFSDLAAPARATRYHELADAIAFQPFDLQAGPFARVALVRLTSHEHMVLATLHHIASDGSSVSLFFQELGTLYNAYSTGQPVPLPEPLIQYRDYAAWQRQRTGAPAADADIDYWLEQLKDALPLLDLPTDRPHPACPNHVAATESLVLPEQLIGSLRDLAHGCHATLFMAMLAAFDVLMARLAGTDDVVIGIPVAGRDIPGTEALIGCFINVLPLRARLCPGMTFRELLDTVRSTAQTAYAHQRLPFAQLVEHLNPERSNSYPPVTQVLFNYRCNLPSTPLEFEGLHANLERVAQTGSVDQLGMEVIRADGGVRCGMLYSTELFDGETIARWLGHYRTLLEAIVANPDAAVARLPLLTTNQRACLLEPPAASASINREQCAHALIEAQARRTPNAIAAVLDNECLTYAQLDRRVNAIAHQLRDSGVAADMLVGVCLERRRDRASLAVQLFAGRAIHFSVDRVGRRTGSHVHRVRHFSQGNFLGFDRWSAADSGTNG